VPTSTPDTLLSIAATGDSWVEVVNGSGRVVMQRMLKTGDVIEFSTAPPYAVVLGRADAARVTVRGQPFDVMPYARNSVARFEVK
jgi:cytoskeleton protein RodZ